MRDWLNRRFPAALMARRNLKRARARSLLAALGIVIGVIAIAGLGLFGSAFQRSQMQTIGQIGNDVQVYPGEDAGFAIDERQLREIERAAGNAEIIPLKNRFARVTVGGRTDNFQLYALSDPASLYEPKAGYIPDRMRGGVLVGSDVASEYDLEPGNAVTIEGSTYRVKAVLRDRGRAAIGRANDGFVVPESTVDIDGYSQVVVRTESTTGANETAVAIKQSLNGRKEMVRVFERGDIAEQIDQAFAQINTFLIGIGGISLLVAGVSILNVMLMSVIERRAEIGVLRAVGYQKWDVLRVLLTEAAALGVLGAVVGVLVSLGIGAFVNDLFLNDPMAFDSQGLSYVLWGFLFGVGASLLSGLYPAWKAANERPVEALRN